MIDPNIRSAYTLPSTFYRSELNFMQLRERVYRRSWNFAGVMENTAANVVPLDLLPGFIDEPLVLTRDREGNTRCLSNVCTHRGNLLVEQAGDAKILTCRYHGRCFGLDG